jgi:uncharacterized protein YdaU (DUF1376 family)
MGKIRRVDWSPSEWLAGTRGVLTTTELAVYDLVLNIIYDRGDAAPNDPAYLAGHFKLGRHETWRGITRSVRASLDRLIEVGKLRLSNDEQWLSNGRADLELGKANDRIDGASRAGVASGVARRTPRHRADIGRTSGEHRADIKREASHVNGLARTSVRIINHQPSIPLSESLTGAAREAEPSPAARPARADVPVPVHPMPAPLGGNGSPVGAPDRAVVEQAIRDLGIDPDSVPVPAAPALAQSSPPVSDAPVAKSARTRPPTTSERLAAKAVEARRKFMEGGS